MYLQTSVLLSWRWITESEISRPKIKYIFSFNGQSWTAFLKTTAIHISAVSSMLLCFASLSEKQNLIIALICITLSSTFIDHLHFLFYKLLSINSINSSPSPCKIWLLGFFLSVYSCFLDIRILNLYSMYYCFSPSVIGLSTWMWVFFDIQKKSFLM